MPKPLAGGHELLCTHQGLSGSEEDHITLRRVDPIVLQRQAQKIKNWLKNQSLLCVDQKKELEMTTALEEGSVASTSSRSIQREAQRTPEDKEMSQEPLGQGKWQSKLAQTLPAMVQDPQIGAFSCGQCLQYGQDSYGIHSHRAGED
ncbi:hypothetical protein O181_053983 [Austropuccinia psidii MF-1]|uniref:Uncharacterized protein n=1 Tax=Austropuccinia psidii MF-1 TaxID=1389203 RepID=A0A9Q3HQY7_9BASI|nr:hypothetical protein [Austropuccinia psidii MF-1]